MHTTNNNVIIKVGNKTVVVNTSISLKQINESYAKAVKMVSSGDGKR